MALIKNNLDFNNMYNNSFLYTTLIPDALKSL